MRDEDGPEIEHGYLRIALVASCAVDDIAMTPELIRLYVTLGTYASRRNEGWCWPSQATIAQRLGIARKKINAQMGELVRLGYIERRSNWRPDGGRDVSSYRLVYDFQLPAERDRSRTPCPPTGDRPCPPAGTPCPPTGDRGGPPTGDRGGPPTGDRGGPPTGDRASPPTGDSSEYGDPNTEMKREVKRARPRAAPSPSPKTETAEAEAEWPPAETAEGEWPPAERPQEVPAGKRPESPLFAAARAAALVPPTEPPGGWRPTSLAHLQRWTGSAFGRAMLRSRGVDPDTWRASELWSVYRSWLDALSEVRAASAPGVVDAS